MDSIRIIGSWLRARRSVLISQSTELAGTLAESSCTKGLSQRVELLKGL